MNNIIKKLKHGSYVTCEIEGVKLSNAQISINENGWIFICHNSKKLYQFGTSIPCVNKLGYNYSWLVEPDWDTLRIGIKNLKIVDAPIIRGRKKPDYSDTLDKIFLYPTEILDRLTAVEKGLKELKEKPVIDKLSTTEEVKEEPKPLDEYDPNWRAEVGEDYWYITVHGEIDYHRQYNDIADNNLWLAGNYYRTKELAERIGLPKFEKEKAKMRIARYIAKERLQFEPDWGDENQNKYCIALYDLDRKNFLINSSCNFQCLSIVFFFKSEDDAQKVIDNCEAELKILNDIK